MDKPFLMPIENTYSIAGRGTVVTGQIERGMIKKGTEVEIVGYKSRIKSTVTGQFLEDVYVDVTKMMLLRKCAHEQ